MNVIQHKSAAFVAATANLSFTSPNTVGNLLVYCVVGQNSTLPTVSDNNSNSILSGESTSGSIVGMLVSFVNSCNAGANQITGAQSGGTRIHIHIWEFGGFSLTPFDSATKNVNSQTATAQSISTAAPTSQAAEMVFGLFYDQPNNDTLTAGTGFNTSEFVNGGSGNESSLSEVMNVSSIGTQAATCTSASGSNVVWRIIVTFEGASGVVSAAPVGGGTNIFMGKTQTRNRSEFVA